MSNPQQTTREVIEQLVEALDHCMDAITERGLNGSPDQAEKWGLQLPLERAYAARAAGQQALEQTQTQVEAELSHTDVLLEECKMDWSGDVIQIKAEHKYEIETLRAQLAALQSDDELPELPGPVAARWPSVPGSHKYAGAGGCAPGSFGEDSEDLHTTDQLQAYARQAQAMVRAKMVPLEKDAIDAAAHEAHGDMAEEYGFKTGVRWAEEQHGITGEPK